MKLYQALKSAVELNITSYVNDSPKHVRQIALDVNADEEFIFETLRTLVLFDFFAETSEKHFATYAKAELTSSAELDADYAQRMILLSEINNLV